MSKIFYPAVFHEDDNSYWVEFPDLEGCFTNGLTIEEAFLNASEALGLYLDLDDDSYERTINKPSQIKDVINNNPGLMVILEYARKYKTKAIKKTLSIPEWLNDLACKDNVNFSNVLQDALIDKLLNKN